MPHINELTRFKSLLRRPVVLYGLILACGLVALKMIEYWFFSYRIAQQTYSGLIALFFTLVGIVVGLMVLKHRHKQQTEQPNAPVMTHIENKLLTGLAKGMSNQQLADQHHVSINTIKTHLKTLYRKLEVDSRQKAVHKAKLLKIIRE